MEMNEQFARMIAEAAGIENLLEELQPVFIEACAPFLKKLQVEPLDIEFPRGRREN